MKRFALTILLVASAAVAQPGASGVPSSTAVFTVNERSAATLTLQFFHQNVQVLPTGVQCWVHDLETNRELWARQTWTPTTKDLRVTLPSAIQDIVRDGYCAHAIATPCVLNADCGGQKCLLYAREKHLLSCEWQYNGENFAAEVPFDVNNFQHVPYVTSTPTPAPTATPS